MNEVRSRLMDMLWEEQPKLYVHGAGDLCIDHTGMDGVEEAWPLSSPVLKWLADTLPEGACTLETGCGYSTILFMICGTRHTAIAPDYQQHGRIVQWCNEKGVSCEKLNLVNARSQDALPGMTLPPLDLVLIDGCHAFPAPYMDWYYTAEKIKKDGYVIVDDCHLITGKVLAEFLDAEKDRWILDKTFGKTIVFRKVTADPVVEGYEWIDQPYCAQLHHPMVRLSCLKRLGNKVRRLLNRPSS